jgi:tetratricopeptide (TPR) repeat protein
MSTQRAHRAELEAKQTRAISEQARAGAEHLLGYLTDDFVSELESFGRLNIVAEFTKQQIDYFHALPPALQGVETTRNGALAMVHYATAMRRIGSMDAASANAAEAIQLLERLRHDGDRTEATTIALALAYAIQSQILDIENDPRGLVSGKQAYDLLRPVAEAPHASVAARRVFVGILVRRGYEQQSDNQNEAAVLSEQQAMRLTAELGALDVSDIEMAANYAESGAWLVTALQNLGRNDEARRVGEESVAVADKVLQQRPGHRLALHAQQVIESALAGVAQNDLNPGEALRFSQRGEQISYTLLNLDPKNLVSINNLGAAHQSLGDALWAAGRLREAVPYYSKMVDDFTGGSVGGVGPILVLAYQMDYYVGQIAQLGDASGTAVVLAKMTPILAKLRQTEPKSSMAPVIVEAMQKAGEAEVAFERDDLGAARRIAFNTVSEVQPTKPERGLQEVQKYVSLFTAADIAGRADYELGNYADAERAQRVAVDARKRFLTAAVSDRRDLAEKSTWLAMAIARQGRLEEAAQVIAPVVKFHRELAAKNHGDQWQPLELAAALYAESLTDGKRRAALLQEAAALVNGLPASFKALHDVRQWRERIQAEARGAAERGAA